MLKSVFRFLASVGLTVGLLIVLSGVLIGATFLEAARGREQAQWFIYDSRWFIGLLALLAINSLAALLARFPWRRNQLGFMLTHVGLLALLVGAGQTYRSGIVGRISLRPGEQTDRLVLPNDTRITVLSSAEKNTQATSFTFRPGPADWPEGRVVNFKEENGLGLKVLSFLRHATEKIEWVADEQDFQGPAIKLALQGATGRLVAEDWLTASRYGGEAIVGPTRYELFPVPVETMLADFVDPPATSATPQGVLSIHYQGRLQRVVVAEQLGKQVPLGDSGTKVELCEYIPNARPAGNGRFISRGDKPTNPLLELKIYEAGQPEPLRQVAFVKLPLLTLDGVTGRDCPVKFWYHHAGQNATPGARFLQTPAGKLYCRAVKSGAFEPAVEVQAGTRIPIGGDFAITIGQHLPRARQDITFQPAEAGPQAAEAEAAALLEVHAGATVRQVWLKRNDLQFGFQRIPTDAGLLGLSLENDSQPLGFIVQLKEFKRNPHPSRQQETLVTSTLLVKDEATEPGAEHELASGTPLQKGKFTLFQSGVREIPGGMSESVVMVTYDPGKYLKYLGGLLLACGTIVLVFGRVRKLTSGAQVTASQPDATTAQPGAEPTAPTARTAPLAA